jgi:micrococcal nuclease
MVHAVDGAPIDVPLDGRQVRVRAIGVNTPETTHPTGGPEPCGPEAAAANRRLVEGQTVRLALDVQPWEQRVPWKPRLLAYGYVGGVMVNAALVRQRYTQVATYPPNVRYADHFRPLQRDARQMRTGCWKAP